LGAALLGVARIGRALVAVVAVLELAGGAHAVGAGVLLRAHVVVGVAGLRDDFVGARLAGLLRRIAEVLGARVLVVARRFVGLAVAVVVLAVARFVFGVGRHALGQAILAAGALARALADHVALGVLGFDETRRLQLGCRRGFAAGTGSGWAVFDLGFAHALLAGGAVDALDVLAHVVGRAVAIELAVDAAEAAVFAEVDAEWLFDAERRALLVFGAGVADAPAGRHADIGHVAADRHRCALEALGAVLHAGLGAALAARGLDADRVVAVFVLGAFAARSTRALTAAGVERNVVFAASVFGPARIHGAAARIVEATRVDCSDIHPRVGFVVCAFAFFAAGTSH